MDTLAILTSRALAMVIVTAVLAAACRGGSEQWGPFRGQVVDAETGKPIAGANVYVEWTRNPPALHFREDFYAARETVTDVDGRFTISALTPLVPVFVEAPGFGFFAPGYVPEAEVVSPSNGRRYVDRTVVKMRRLSREEECRNRHETPVMARNSVPKFVEAVQQYNIQLKCWTTEDKTK